MTKIAYFISEHGFGHAARSCAVMQKLLKRGNYHFIVFSLVPKWFFESSLGGNFEYIPLQTDIGIIQENPFQEDLGMTIEHLVNFYPISKRRLERVINIIQKFDVDFLISDISPLGLLAASKMNIPSMLIENFTWDWIYESYISIDRRFENINRYLSDIYSLANFHIQSEPLCNRNVEFPGVAPIFRDHQSDRKEIRQQLNIPGDAKMVLITLGGIPINESFINLEHVQDCYFVIPGMNITNEERRGNVIALPHNHLFFHPDLINASDIVLGKVGYSTIAEVYSCGVYFFYIARDNFRESIYLEQYIQKNLKGSKIELAEFLSGDWVKNLSLHHDSPLSDINPINGADLVTELINKLFGLNG